MSTPEERAEMLRKQVIAKIHWNATEQEVRDWLQEEKGIAGDEADRLITIAHSERRKAVRSRAILMLIISGAFITLSISYFIVQIRGGFIIVGKPVVVFLSVGGISVVYFIRSLCRFLSGKTSGPID